MRIVLFLLLVVPASITALADTPPASDSEAAEKPTSFWMEKKMEYAQSMLRGLASADFQSIAENARQLRLLNRVEGFVRRRHVSYRTQLNTFEHVCDDMIKQADKENLPGVTLAFNQLTISCVSCHQSLRTPPVNDEANSDSDKDSDSKGKKND